jgi:hypothetical protein
MMLPTPSGPVNGDVAPHGLPVLIIGTPTGFAKALAPPEVMALCHETSCGHCGMAVVVVAQRLEQTVQDAARASRTVLVVCPDCGVHPDAGAATLARHAAERN